MDFPLSIKKQPLGLKRRGVSELSVLRRSCAQLQQPDYPKINQEQKILDLTGRIYDFRLPLPPGLQVLDLSDNIGLETEFIFDYDIPTLQTLRLNHCDITELPSEAPRIASNLRTFTLDGNLLTHIPNWVFEMPELNELSLYGNEIQSVSFPQNSHLIKIINLSFNPITQISTDKNFNVQLLNLTQTQLSSIPDLFLPQLKTLYLSKCCIEGHLDYSICSDLSSLDISFNKIKSLSDNFVNSCKCLTNLNLSNNELESLPECFSCPPSLTKVSFSNNRLTTLPTAFMNSLSLENLNISYNRIEKLPPFKFRQLRYLNISNNQISELPDCFDISFFLTSLNASFNKLTDLPHSMISCRQILELNCTSNSFNHIPSVIFSFVTLKTLIFSGNTITTVPDSLSALLNLTVFDLSNNNITIFPHFIQKMLELRVISFSHNRISAVTDINFPPKVQSIDLSFNIIRNLSINPLTSLANLAIQYNRLTNVPNLADFPNLQFFSIACNNIDENSSIELFDTCSAEIEVFGNNDHVNVSNRGKAHLTDILPSNHFGIGIASSLGTRQTMEDAFTITSTENSDFLAIFDGHAGPNASRKLSDYIGDQIFKKINANNVLSADEISNKIASILVESNQYIKSLNIIDGSTAAGILVTRIPSFLLNKSSADSNTSKEETNNNENIDKEKTHTDETTDNKEVHDNDNNNKEETNNNENIDKEKTHTDETTDNKEVHDNDNNNKEETNNNENIDKEKTNTDETTDSKEDNTDETTDNKEVNDNDNSSKEEANKNENISKVETNFNENANKEETNLNENIDNQEINISENDIENNNRENTINSETEKDNENTDNKDATEFIQMMYVFGIGDSRVLYVSKNEGNDIQLTKDHKPTNADEYKRLKKAGFFISPEGRISRKLAVSRTMGDFWCHEDGLFVEPEIFKLPINIENDVGVIIACDGLWDVISNEIAADVLRKSETASDAAITLKNLAIASGSQDNVSIIVIVWNPKKGDEGIAVRNTVAELPPYIEAQEVNDAPTAMTQLPPRNRRRR